jgi:hypothetical protein
MRLKGGCGFLSVYGSVRSVHAWQLPDAEIFLYRSELTAFAV